MQIVSIYFRCCVSIPTQFRRPLELRRRNGLRESDCWGGQKLRTGATQSYVSMTWEEDWEQQENEHERRTNKWSGLDQWQKELEGLNLIFTFVLLCYHYFISTFLSPVYSK